MRIAIIGDSFAESFENTWLETLCNDSNLKLMHHKQQPGCSQFWIYKNFLKILNYYEKPEVILMFYTEISRFYHPKMLILKSTVKHEKRKRKINLMQNFEIKKSSMNDELINAIDLYYKHLYNEEYSSLMYSLMINDIQNKCKEKNIKLINIPCFAASIDKNYGLWINFEGGFVNCSRSDDPTCMDREKDERLNHLSSYGHILMAEILIPIIKNYLNSNKLYEQINLDHNLFFEACKKRK